MQATLDKLTVPFLTVFFGIVSFFVLAKVFGPIPFTVTSVTTTKSDMFTVDGKGEVNGVPSTAKISVGITQTSTTAELATEEANKVINSITEQVKALGVEDKDIKTSNFNSYPERTFSGRDDISGYTVNQTLDITFDNVENANKGLDIATAAGANSIGGVQFTFDDAKKEELEEQARMQAIENAKKKAEKLANAAGLKLGRVMNVSESMMGGEPMPMYERATMNMAKDAVAVAEPVQLNPGESKVVIQVYLSYETL